MWRNCGPGPRRVARNEEAGIALLAVGMAILGLSTFLQCAPRGPVGSGYLCPATFTAT
jgi:hypothetical protein